jgi:hypothetical protein
MDGKQEDNDNMISDNPNLHEHSTKSQERKKEKKNYLLVFMNLMNLTESVCFILLY